MQVSGLSAWAVAFVLVFGTGALKPTQAYFISNAGLQIMPCAAVTCERLALTMQRQTCSRLPTGQRIFASDGGSMLSLRQAWSHAASFLRPRGGSLLPSVQYRQGGTVLRMAWEQFIDDDSGVPYYYNTVSGETTWEKPAVEKPKVGSGTKTIYRDVAAAAPAVEKTEQRGGTRYFTATKAGGSTAEGAEDPTAPGAAALAATKTLTKRTAEKQDDGIFGKVFGATKTLMRGKVFAFPEGPAQVASPAAAEASVAGRAKGRRKVNKDSALIRNRLQGSDVDLYCVSAPPLLVSCSAHAVLAAMSEEFWLTGPISSSSRALLHTSPLEPAAMCSNREEYRARPKLAPVPWPKLATSLAKTSHLGI